MIASLLDKTFRTAVAPGLATTAMLPFADRAEFQPSAASLNAVAHIPFGDKAFQQEKPSLKYTATGAALNILAVASWSAVYEVTFGHAARRGSRWAGVVGGPAIAALAYVTDFHLVPDRLTPGFERKLSKPALLGVYVLLAATLPLASLASATQSDASR